MDSKTYPNYVKEKATGSSLLLNCIKAFLVGGTVCLLGQGLFVLYRQWIPSEETCRLLVSCTLIVLAAILTGIGIFDRLAKHAGAGTLVPITGFANAVTAPAIDTTAEGMVLGLGAKIFTIAGPVILYGTLASFLYGIAYYLIR